MHSIYALALGSGVVLFAAKGFEHARVLGASLAGVWLLVLLFFRLFARGADDAERETGTKRVGFYVITYAIKNLYQGMLFFLLPFYWKSTTFFSVNAGFVVLLAIVAVLSTLDIVFDRFVMRYRWLASILHGVILFACLYVVFPAFIPASRNVVSLCVAAVVAVLGVLSLHMRFRALKEGSFLALTGVLLVAAPAGAYVVRRAIPPVPMYVEHAGVGPSVLADGRLMMEIESLHVSAMGDMIAVTDVQVPAGPKSSFRHVWRLNGEELPGARVSLFARDVGKKTIRLQSSLRSVKEKSSYAGRWTVDVETTDGQIVGRTSFKVVE